MTAGQGLGNGGVSIAVRENAETCVMQLHIEAKPSPWVLAQLKTEMDPAARRKE